ncbi:MAG: RNA methyltransferase [Pelistega sp.]|nr:RNA methyltransferase [Pelistega sp.]
MKHITSKDNPVYKQLLKVAQGKVKTETLLEGYHLCQMYKCYGQSLLKVILQEGSDYNTEQWQTLLTDISSQQILLLSPSLFKALNHVDTPQAIMFWIEVPIPEQLPLPSKTTVFLDRIQDPGNLGTILRTCAAVGIESIYLSKGCVNPWSAKVLRGGQGAHFVLDIYTQVDSVAFLEANTLPLYITYLDEQAQNLYQATLAKEIVWVMGNEGQGVADCFLDYPHQAIFIPQSDKVESLNVGVACSLVLYEQYRQQALTP